MASDERYSRRGGLRRSRHLLPRPSCPRRGRSGGHGSCGELRVAERDRDRDRQLGRGASQRMVLKRRKETTNKNTI
jgi:hypothetical protein